MLAIFSLRLEGARAPEISRRRLSPSQLQFSAATRSILEPAQPVPARMQHCGTPELLRPQLPRLIVFVTEKLKLGLQFLVKVLRSRRQHSLKPCRGGGANFLCFAFVSIPNLVQRPQRALLKIADWKACPPRMAGFWERFYPVFQRRWLSFRVRVLSVLAATEQVSTSRSCYRVRWLFRAMRSG